MKKKCICKNCEDCKLFIHWNMTDDKGQQKVEQKCGLQVLFEEIPRIRGAIDGLQSGVNEARNRSMETKERVEDLGNVIVSTAAKITNTSLKRVK